VTATYPGASAETLENSVTQIIEQQLTGLDNLLYFSSTSSSAGTADHGDLRQGHRSRYGAGAGAEQGAAGHIAPAHAGAAARVTVTKSNADFLMVIACMMPRGGTIPRTSAIIWSAISTIRSAA
jgi:multidrug efflux pump